MHPEIKASVTLEATVAPSEDVQKVLSAMKNVLGIEPDAVLDRGNRISIETFAENALDRLHDQLRDRRIRSVARRRLLSARAGDRTVLMVNRQAAFAGVAALCDDERESPLGPIYLKIKSRKLDSLIDWLTDQVEG